MMFSMAKLTPLSKPTSAPNPNLAPVTCVIEIISIEQQKNSGKFFKII